MKCKIVQFDDEWNKSRRLVKGLFHGADLRCPGDLGLLAETFFKEVFFLVELRDEIGFSVDVYSDESHLDFLFDRLGLDKEFWGHKVEEYMHSNLIAGREVTLIRCDSDNQPGFEDNTCTIQIDELTND